MATFRSQITGDVRKVPTRLSKRAVPSPRWRTRNGLFPRSRSDNFLEPSDNFTEFLQFDPWSEH
jgi:hypothetical protein